MHVVPRWGSRVVLVAALVLFWLSTAGFAAGADSVPASEPLPSPLFETIQPRLVLLDYSIVGTDGVPLCEIDKGTLSLLIDSKSWPIESVDVLRHDDAPRVATYRTTSADRGPLDVAARTAPARHIAFFVDLAQITWGSRQKSLDLVAEWLEKHFRDGDIVTIILSGSAVRTVAERERVARRALDAMEGALEDATLHDVFPNGRNERVARCEACDARTRCCKELCAALGGAERTHASRSLKRLLGLLRSLDAAPGGTSLVYVHETGLLMSNALFRFPSSSDWGAFNVFNDITAEASLRNVMIHTAMVGLTARAGRADAIHVGANFHERTGGSYNREPAQLPAVLDSIGRLPACVVRVGFRPPKSRQGRIHWARLEAPGVVVPRTRAFRVRSVADIWGERAARALREPEAHEQIHLCAAIVPVGRTRRAWVVEARLALPLRGLLARREASGALRSHWEIAAVIEDPGSTAAWGYEGSREAFAESEAARHSAWVEHRARLVTKSPALALHAMAGDRTTWDMGATTARLELGGDDGPMLAAPVVFARVARTESSRFAFERTSEKGPTVFEDALEALDDGYVPASCVTTGAIREARVATLACDERSSRTFGGDVKRVLMRAGRPIARLEPVEEFSQRGCRLFIDDLVVPDGLELSAEFEVAAIYDRPGGEHLIARSPLSDGAFSSPAAATPDSDSARRHSPESPR